MKEMTTAEFAKANLAALAEPVSVRRYTQVVGTYYPKGFEPAGPPTQTQLEIDGLINASHMEGEVRVIDDLTLTGVSVVAPAATKAAAKVIEDLTEEVARLKRELAARPAEVHTTIEAVSAPRPVSLPRAPRTDDPFVGLAKQDREFFERKLGTGKKKS